MPSKALVVAGGALLLALSACSGQPSGSPSGSPSPSGAASTSASAVSSPSASATSVLPSASDSATPAPSEDPAGEADKDSVKAVDGVVDGDAVAEDISHSLVGIVGRAPQSLTCPDVKAAVGTSVTCTLGDSGQTYDVAVDVTSVKGSAVSYAWKVASSPR